MVRRQSIPAPHLQDSPFWDACKEQRLLLQRCRSCGAYSWHPIRFCGYCLSDDTEWVPVSGWGRVQSCRMAPGAGARGAPSIIARVDLAEGIRLISRLVGVDLDRVRAGTPVRFVCDCLGQSFLVPTFRALGGEATAA